MARAHVGAGYDANIDTSSSLADAQGAANWAAGAAPGAFAEDQLRALAAP